MNKEHTRNQKRMYRIHKQEEKIHDLELLIGTLQQENQKYKEVIDKIRKICSNVPYDWSVCGIDVVHKIENILKEVE